MNTGIVTRLQLELLPPPQPLGRHHKPIPHAEFVAALHSTLPEVGLNVKDETWSLSRDAGRLFGTLIFETSDDRSIPGTALQMGIRTSVDESIAAEGVAGRHVFVCSNGAFYGDSFLFHKKSTTGLDLYEMVAHALQRYIHVGHDMDQLFVRMQDRELRPSEEGELIAGLIRGEIIPDKYITAGARAYYEAQPEETDITPRTAWGLYNGFTRQLRDVGLGTKLDHTQQLTKYFAKSVA